MAALEKIRSKAVLLIVVVGVALFAFILTDFLQSGSTFFNMKKENVAVVDGHAIKYREYQQLVEERTNMIKMRGNGATITEEQTHQIRQGVLNEMVNKILLEDASEKVGFAVSREELVDLIMGENISPMIQQMPDFQNAQTGQFDRNQLLQFLQSIEIDDYTQFSEAAVIQLLTLKKNWLMIEQQIAEQQLQGKLMALLSAAIVTNNIDAKAAHEDNKVSVDFDYVVQSFSSISDEQVSVSDAEIAKLYNERKDNFKQEEAKVIDYIAVNILPSDKDYQAALEKLNDVKAKMAETTNVANIVTENSEAPYMDAYVSYSQLSPDLKNFIDNSPRDEVKGPQLSDKTYSLYKFESETIAPDSIRINVIALPNTMEETAMRQIADSLINVINSGTPFSDIALSATGGQSNGDMNWQTESSLVSQVDATFKDEVFAASLNTPQVVKSAFGSFLVQVVEKTEPVKKYKIATVQVTVTPSQETKTKLYNDLNQYTSTNHTLEMFKASASEAGYNIQSDVEVGRNQLSISNIQNTRQIILWAFDNKKGEISNIYECQNQEYFVVAAVKGSLKEGIRPLESVSDILKRELLKDKKAEKIIADLKAKNLSSFTQYAEAMNANPQSVKFVSFSTTNITGIGNEPILNAKAPMASVGEVAGPLKGNNGVYVISITDKQESEQPFDLASQKQSLQMLNGYRAYQFFQSGQILREHAKIEDNLSRFF